MNYDLAVIGSGPGGYVAAIRAAQLGLKTVCIEKRKTLGGTCLNVGCIPSKALLQATEHLQFLKTKGGSFGLNGSNVSLDFSKMMEHKNQVVQGTTSGVQSLFKKNKIETLFGEAQFLADHQIAVGDSVIEAKNIILATGSEPIPLPFIPFDSKKILSSTEMLELTHIPKKLAVIGAGVIGVELASVYARLGTEVTLIEMLNHICGNLDANVHQHYLSLLTKQGLHFHLEAAVQKGEVKENSVLIHFKKENQDLTLESDIVLVAVGRKPYTENLGLEKIHIQKTPKGFIQVDDFFKTNIDHIYAIGDLIEGPMLAHRASEEGIAVAEIIAGQTPHIDYMAIPNIIYTHPEVASVGLTEQEAKALGLELITGICHFKAIARARCANETEGFVKVIGEKSTGRLLGMHILGAHASELIAEGTLALAKKSTLPDLAQLPNGHPTLSEAIKEACLAALGKSINI